MLLTPFIAPFMALINRIIPDKAKQDEAKAEMLTIMVQAQAKEIESKASIIVAEAQGESTIQRTWRPILALCFGLISGTVIAFNHLVFPLLAACGLDVAPLPLDAEVWYFNMVCIGGYIQSRSSEKRAAIKLKTFNQAKYFKSLRDSYGSLSQEMVDAQNKAIEDAKK